MIKAIQLLNKMTPPATLPPMIKFRSVDVEDDAVVLPVEGCGVEDVVLFDAFVVEVFVVPPDVELFFCVHEKLTLLISDSETTASND